jgi:hypothetical protein
MQSIRGRILPSASTMIYEPQLGDPREQLNGGIVRILGDESKRG